MTRLILAAALYAVCAPGLAPVAEYSSLVYFEAKSLVEGDRYRWSASMAKNHAWELDNVAAMRHNLATDRYLSPGMACVLASLLSRLDDGRLPKARANDWVGPLPKNAAAEVLVDPTMALCHGIDGHQAHFSGMVIQ